MKTRTLSNGRTISVHENRGLYKRCSCVRRRWSTCPHSWTFSFKWQDTLHRFPLDRAVGRHVGRREDAKREADRLRTLIRDDKSPFATPTPETPSALTFDAYGAVWHERARAATSPTQRKNDTILLRRLGNLTVGDGRLGDWPIGRITEDDLEVAFLQVASLAHSTQNKLRQTLMHLQTWGVEKGYLPRVWSTFSKRHPTLKRKKGARRERRLLPGEEDRLRQHATPWLRNLIVALLESCCRRGELLTLQWKDVNLARREMTLRAENTKTDELRRLPLSTTLVAVLEHIRTDPKGQPHPSTAYVFGDKIGRQLKDPKKAWAKCCRLAGVTDLKLHDLRHEAASRLLETGWPLQDVQAMLGHKDAKTTSIYVNTTLGRLHDTMRRFGTQPFHTVSHEADTSHGLVGNAGPETDANTLIN